MTIVEQEDAYISLIDEVSEVDNHFLGAGQAPFVVAAGPGPRWLLALPGFGYSSTTNKVDLKVIRPTARRDENRSA